LSYIHYSTIDVGSAFKTGRKWKTKSTNLRELDVVKNPPKLKSKSAVSVRRFCEERDRYLGDLARLYNEDGEMYEPQDLLTSTNIYVKDWLSSILSINPDELTVVHMDAFLIVSSKFDPTTTDVEVEVADLLKKNRIHYDVGELVHSYIHSLVASSKRLIKTYDILDIINRDPKIFRACVETVCSRLPSDYIQRNTKEYVLAVRNPKSPMFKNFFEFLDTLLASFEGESVITKYTFKSNKNDQKDKSVLRSQRLHHYSMNAYKEEPESCTSSSTEDDEEDTKVKIAFQTATSLEKSCWGCGDKGHMLQQCPKKYKGEEKRKLIKEKLKELRTNTKKIYRGINQKKPDTKAKQIIREFSFNYMAEFETDSSTDDETNSENVIDKVEEIVDSEESDTNFNAIGIAVCDMTEEDSDVESSMLNNYEKVEDCKHIEELWSQNLNPDKIISARRTALLFPESEHQDGLAVKIKTKYLGDSGCLGMNVGGKELLEKITQFNLPFEIREVKPSFSLSAAFPATAKVTHVIKATVVCYTTHEYPLVQRNVFIHIVNVRLNTIFLGTRFCKQAGILTTNEQIDNLAKQMAAPELSTIVKMEPSDIENDQFEILSGRLHDVSTSSEKWHETLINICQEACKIEDGFLNVIGE
jgi:hypothetical protein